LETYNSEFAVEAETSDGEQAPLFRSIAMDRTNIQFAVKTLSSYMFRTSMKVLAALKHLTSYSDGMPDRGILLKVTEEGKSLSNFWREHDLVQSEATIPKRPSKSHFTL